RPPSRRAAAMLTRRQALKIAALAGLAVAIRPARADDAFKVGVTSRRFVPPPPYDWRGSPNQALVTTIWYPPPAGAKEWPPPVAPPGAPLFDVGPGAPGAALAPAPARLPLILLSHGTGGTALTLGWLGTALAARGYVVAAVNHPGNNAID